MLISATFRIDYVDPSLSFGDYSKAAEQEYLSRKSSASSTASLDRAAGREDKLSGVRAKIAMFSSEVTASKPGKYQSSEDVAGKAGAGGREAALTRAHTHSDVRFEDSGSAGLRRQAAHGSHNLSLKSLSSDTPATAKNAAAFRSMINVSSSSEGGAGTGEAGDSQKVIWEEGGGGQAVEKPRGPAPSISSRSQSLNCIGAGGRGGRVAGRPGELGNQGRSRSSTVITAESGRKGSMSHTQVCGVLCRVYWG